MVVVVNLVAVLTEVDADLEVSDVALMELAYRFSVDLQVGF